MRIHLTDLLLEEASKEMAKEIENYLHFILTRPPEEPLINHTHHILPKSLYPEFQIQKENSWNFVKLSLPDHIEAHRLPT